MRFLIDFFISFDLPPPFLVIILNLFKNKAAVKRIKLLAPPPLI